MAVIGNLVPVVFLLTFLKPFEEVARAHSKKLNDFFNWWFRRVVSRHEEKFIKWGTIALIVLVAIPLPMTGAWTGSVAAHLFKIDKIPAFLYITIGVIIAGVIVTMLTITGTNLF